MTPLFASSFSVEAPEGAAWEFLVLFLVVILGPPLVQRARIPGIIGLLVGGFLIGPHGLDLITAGNTTVPELGKVGLLYLMFVAGVELDLSLLRVHRRAALGFGVLTFAFPMVLGTLGGIALGFSTPAALLLGSLLASHTLVLYPLMRDRGVATDPAIASAVGATVLTDTLALTVLAAVAGSNTQGGSTTSVALQIGLGMVILLSFSLVALPRIVSWAFRLLGRDRTVRYVLAFAAFLAAAALSDMLGIEGIVGAFFAGLALNRFVPNHGPLMDRIEFFGSAVFIPVFLVSVGLLLDPSVMFQAQTLEYAAVFVLACLGGKAAAAALTRPLMGYSGPQSTGVFALTTPQAAATLAATIVGFNIGLFGESVVNAVLVLILVSVVVATLVAEWSAARIPQATSHGHRLGDHVLIAIEDPDRAAAAVAIAAAITAPDGGVARALLVRRRGDLPADGADLESIAAAGFAIGIDVDPRIVVSRSLADGVVDAAAAEGASLVLVVELDGPASPAFGTWAEAVAGAAPAPVAILRGTATQVGDVHLRAAGDGNAGDPAARLAAEIARRVAGGSVSAHDPCDPPTPGATAIASVDTWEALEAAAAPAGGSLLLVPAPTVPTDEQAGPPATPPAGTA